MSALAGMGIAYAPCRAHIGRVSVATIPSYATGGTRLATTSGVLIPVTGCGPFHRLLLPRTNPAPHLHPLPHLHTHADTLSHCNAYPRDTDPSPAPHLYTVSHSSADTATQSGSSGPACAVADPDACAAAADVCDSRADTASYSCRSGAAHAGSNPDIRASPDVCASHAASASSGDSDANPVARAHAEFSHDRGKGIFRRRCARSSGRGDKPCSRRRI